MSDLDPQGTPGDTGTDDGQSGDNGQNGAPESAEESVNRKLEELAKRNEELQRRLTKQGRELAEHREATKSPSGGKTPEFWEDPEARIAARLEEMERRLESRRQTEQMLRDFADEKGIPVRELQRLNEELQGAASDPAEYLEVLARLHTARNTSEAIRKVTQTAQESAARNARAVTAESGGGHTEPPPKPVSEMSIEEHRAYLAQSLGEEPQTG